MQQPYKQIGRVKNASKDAVINLDVIDGTVHIGVYITRPRLITIQLLANGQLLFEQAVNLSPEAAFMQAIDMPSGVTEQQLTLRVCEGERELITYSPVMEDEPVIPQPASPARPPEEIESNEELFLNGQHLEQYRHATYEPEPYYLEALRRDPADSRCNNAMGLILLRRGKFAEAEIYFRTAVKSITRRNPNPYDGEPYYNLGLALKMQGQYRQARDHFYKAVWNAAWQDSGYFELARLACREARFDEALELIALSLVRNAHHHQAHHLKIALLRHLGWADAAQREIDQSLNLDRMNLGALYEQFLLTGDTAYQALMSAKANNSSKLGWITLRRDYSQVNIQD